MHIDYDADRSTVLQTVHAMDTKGLRDLLTQLYADYQVKRRTFWKRVIPALAVCILLPTVLILTVGHGIAANTWEYWSFHLSTSFIFPLSGLRLIKLNIADPYYRWRDGHLLWVMTLDVISLERFTVPTAHIALFGKGAPTPPTDDAETPPHSKK